MDKLSKSNTDSGFTTLEVMYAVVIIGILMVITLPVVAEYNSRGFDSRIRSDLRHMATAQEAFFVDTDEYYECWTTTQCAHLPGLRHLSPDTNLRVELIGDDEEGFLITASHPGGSKVCTWDSLNDGYQGCA